MHTNVHVDVVIVQLACSPGHMVMLNSCKLEATMAVTYADTPSNLLEQAPGTWQATSEQVQDSLLTLLHSAS